MEKDEDIGDKTYRLDETPFELFTKHEGSSADDLEGFMEDGSVQQDEIPLDAPESKPHWRNAKSLIKLKQQINAAYPNRKRDSDGHIGDNAHCSNAGHTGSSDHCLNIEDNGTKVVTAMDITHDPKNCDVDGIVEAIRSSKNSRIKYIIWNKRICNSANIGGKPAWSWRPYTGKNAHTKHAHFSVKPSKNSYDSIADWQIGTSISDANV